MSHIKYVATIVMALAIPVQAPAFQRTAELEYQLQMYWHDLPCLTIRAALMLDELGSYALVSGVTPADVATEWVERTAEAKRDIIANSDIHDFEKEIPWEVVAKSNAVFLVQCIKRVIEELGYGDPPDQ